MSRGSVVVLLGFGFGFRVGSHYQAEEAGSDAIGTDTIF